ncbi:MAG: TIGR04100 family radical SAM protein [Ruminococcus sp.]|nr:TIGR04100 family radical SAM protein [Ruminococcus sp.]
MKKAMTISYEIGDSLYLNITNKCPCSCTFCIRNNGDGAYGSDPLWLDHQPSFEEVRENLSKRDLGSYRQIVFCGYGEPTCELELLKQTADYIKSVCNVSIRLNTNGLSDLINKRETASELEGRIDCVSISLNAPTKEEYDAVTRPSFDADCYSAMLKFASSAKAYVPEVMFTVVDVIGSEEIERSRKVAESVGVKLRVREFIDE